MSQKSAGFSKLRAFFWPVHSNEISKFIPMMILFFLISFNYHLLRVAKDSLIITAPKAGAEAIPFLKVWAILPSAIFLTFLFTKLSNRFNRENIFYVMTSIFLVFFLLFVCVLFPFKETLFLDKISDYLQTVLPTGFKGFIAIIRYWSYSLFYIMAEGWSTIVLSLLLWGFANDVTKVSEAKRFYALFGIAVNAAGIFAGETGSLVASSSLDGFSISSLILFFGGKTSWDQIFSFLVILIIIITGLSMVLYRFLHIRFFQERASFAGVSPIEKKPKIKMSLRANIIYILKSKYVLNIAIIVLAYNIIINLTEVLWKNEMKELYPSPIEYTAYTSKITLFTGLIATFGSYFISGSFIRRFGWKKTALLTPFVILITALGFFYFLFMRKYGIGAIIFGMSPLAICVFFGSLQNVFSRAAKYTVFDSTKEMAFIPLNDEDKIKSKSAIDGIGSRLGKSGSSLLTQILLMIFASYSAISPIILGALLLIMPFWIFAIRSLDKKFVDAEKEQSLLQEKL